MGVTHYLRCDIAGLMLGVLLANSAPQAHLYQWINVFTEWRFDTIGLNSGVKLHWFFYDYNSVLLVDDADVTLIAYASSLGINTSGGDEHGIQFAETVTI